MCYQILIYCSCILYYTFYSIHSIIFPNTFMLIYYLNRCRLSGNTLEGNIYDYTY